MSHIKKASNVITPRLTSVAPSEISAAIAKKKIALDIAYKLLKICARLRDDLKHKILVSKQNKKKVN